MGSAVGGVPVSPGKIAANSENFRDVNSHSKISISVVNQAVLALVNGWTSPQMGSPMSKPIRLLFIAFVLYSPFARAQPLPKSAREAGARYAQAMGAAETCDGLRVSKTAEALKNEFRGDDLKVFNEQAADVYASWLKVKNCSRPLDPNPCRIMIQLSCQSAVSEIGPEGSAVPHLLEIGSH